MVAYIGAIGCAIIILILVGLFLTCLSDLVKNGTREADYGPVLWAPFSVLVFGILAAHLLGFI